MEVHSSYHKLISLSFFFPASHLDGCCSSRNRGGWALLISKEFILFFYSWICHLLILKASIKVLFTQFELG